MPLILHWVYPSDFILRQGNTLKIETKPRDDHQIMMTVTLDLEEMDAARYKAARKISTQKSIPGFRPGKAPYDVVVRTFGESTITEKAVDMLLDEIYPKALDESKIQPGAAGSLEKVEDLEKEPRFTFTVPLSAKVELGDYRSIRIPYNWIEPSEQEIDNSLEDLRRMYAKTETVARPVSYGDFVMIDLIGNKDTKGESDSPIIERSGFPVFIRENPKEDDWPFAGFTNELLGANVAETKVFTHKFPKSHKDESLSGLLIRFSATIKMIRGSILPDLDDEFAKQVGPFGSIEALRDALKANLSSRSKAEYDDDFFTKVIDAIKEKTVIKYAPQTLDHEISHFVDDIKSQLSRQGMDLPAYLKTREMDEEKFIANEVRPNAIKRLERTLLLDEVARVENIEVSKDQLDNSFQQTFNEMAGNENFQKFLTGKTKPPKQLMDAMAIESANRAYIQLTLERLKSIVTGEISNPELPKGKKRTERKKQATPENSEIEKTTNKKQDGSSQGKVMRESKKTLKIKTPIINRIP